MSSFLNGLMLFCYVFVGGFIFRMGWDLNGAFGKWVARRGGR